MTEDIKKLAKERAADYDSDNEFLNLEGFHLEIMEIFFINGAKAYEEMLLKGASPTKESLLEVVRKWTWHWRGQEARYSVVAWGIDSNMIHHMGDKVVEHYLPTLAKIKKLEEEKTKLENENKILRRQLSNATYKWIGFEYLAAEYIDPMFDEQISKYDAELQAELGLKNG